MLGEQIPGHSGLATVTIKLTMTGEQCEAMRAVACYHQGPLSPLSIFAASHLVCSFHHPGCKFPRRQLLKFKQYSCDSRWEEKVEINTLLKSKVSLLSKLYLRLHLSPTLASTCGKAGTWFSRGAMQLPTELRSSVPEKRARYS